MISLDSVEQTIIELEQKDTSFATCERLASLYIVRDHLKGYNVSPEATIQAEQSSDFLKAVNGKHPEKVVMILDDLMEEVVKVLHPRTYEEVLQRIKRA